MPTLTAIARHLREVEVVCSLPCVRGRETPLSGLVDFSVGHGLEIGPLDRPIAVRPDSDVSYVDVSERKKLRAHYRDDEAVDVDKIPELDFWLEREDGFVSLAEACRPGAPYDWMIASHVIEHIPDVIGWLDQLAGLTNAGAEVALIVPDRRFCFDIHRPATTVGQALEAYDRGDRTPSPRAVFDYHHSVVYMAADKAWAGDIPAFDDRIHTWDDVLVMLERARRGDYVDSHVWLWTPREFVLFIDDLAHLGLVDFVVDRLLPTPEDDLEFYAVLTRLPVDLDGPLRDEHRETVHRAVLAGLPTERTISTPVPPPVPDPVEVLEAEVAHLLTVIAALHARVQRQSENAAALRDKVVAARGQRDLARRRVRRLQARLTEASPAPTPGLLSRLGRRLRRASR
jgi:hypothetical protein